MARINLRPWREELRAERQRQFVVAIVGFAVVGVMFVMLKAWMINGDINHQNARNKFLENEIAKLDDRIKEIEKLREKRDELIERMRVIQELQGNRPVIVHLFDELVRTIPDGVYYSSLNRKGEMLSIKGNAESNNRISSLMRRLDQSKWLDAPNLTSVQANEQEGSNANSFDLSVKRSIVTEGQEG